MTAPADDNPLGRNSLPQSKRIELLEHDRERQSRILTELVDKVGKGFTDQQLAQIRAAMREELADAGLRLDGAEHQDEAREDFRFLRGLRRLRDNMSNKIGNAVITAFIIIAFAIIGSGFWQWINSGGK